MSETITLDKHEMVVDREDFEALEKSHAELLEACKEAKAIILAECNSGAAGSVHGFLELVIAKAEGKS